MQIMKKRVLSLLLALCLVLGSLPLSVLATGTPELPPVQTADTAETPAAKPAEDKEVPVPSVDTDASPKDVPSGETPSDEEPPAPENPSDEESPAGDEEAVLTSSAPTTQQAPTADEADPQAAVDVAPLSDEAVIPCLSVWEDAPTTATIKAGALYELDLEGVFCDTENHSLTYSFESSVSNAQTKINGSIFCFSVPEAKDYQVVLKATCPEGQTISHTLTITVEPAPEGIAAQYGYNETPAESVTVYVTLSNNGMPLMAADDTILSHLEITVPYFDLNLYGLEDFYRYGTDGGKGPYTKETLIQRPTGLHLYIYLLERYFLGMDESQCGKGGDILNISSEDDVRYLDGSTAYSPIGLKGLSITGSATSLYMVNFWGHDENLMYFRNHCYPYMSAGWGSTSDYILLSDGDTWDVAMFSNWDFYHTGYFARFDQDAYTAAPGSELTVSTLKWGTTSESVDFTTITGLDVALYDSQWNSLKDISYTSGTNNLTFTVPEKEGTYYLMATDPNATDVLAAHGAPATARITVSAAATEPDPEPTPEPTPDPVPDPNLRVLTFEDADYKGTSNMLGKKDWSSLIDSPQYGGSMLYPQGDDVTVYNWYDEGNTELKHQFTDEWGDHQYWGGGEAISNYNSGDYVAYGGYDSQLTVFKNGVTGLTTTGGGYNGSNNFAVHYGYVDNSGYGGTKLQCLTFGDGVARVIDHMYVNNICYALNCYMNGNGLTASIGESDWVKLVATGHHEDGSTATAEIYMCNGPENVITDWTKWDLSGLGKITKLELNVMGSSDNGYGFSQPAYFAYDNVAVRFESTAPVEVTGVTLDKTELTLAPKATARLEATVTPENVTDKTVTWTSDNETVATVDENGTVTALAKGTATITATIGDFTATCQVNVNTKPVLKAGVSATKEDISMVGYAYNLPELQYNEVFEDPDGDTLNYTSYFYQRSTDGGETWSEPANFEPSLFGFTTIQFTETKVGTYIYRFRAWDGTEYSDDTYTLTLHVSDTVSEPYSFFVSKDYTGGYPELRIYKAAGVDADGHDYVGWIKKGEETVYIYDPLAHDLKETATGWTADGYTLHDYEPISFTDSLFGGEPTEENPSVKSGTVVNNYAMFYAMLENGNYSIRAYAKNKETGVYDVYAGGQQMILPTEVNVDGGTGGGRAIYLRQVSIYTNTKKDDGTYFTAEEYDASINMNIMQCKPQHGTSYLSGGQTYFPFYIYAAGNAATFTIVVTPKVEGYAISQQINCTQIAGYGAVSRNIALKKALTLTVTAPAEGDFGLYFQWNNFNTTEVQPESTEVSGDIQTLVYKISASESNYTWRLSDPNGQYVTKAGWLSSTSRNAEMTVSFDRTDKKSHSFAGLGSTVATRDEADIQVFLNPEGFMSTSDTYRVRSFRMWELINSDTANIMVEPDTHIQVLQGNAGDIQQVNGGNAGGNWLDVTPTTTDIVAVHYDAIDMDTSNNKTHGGFFPATNPERTGVFIMTNAPAGNADAHIVYNRNPAATSRSDEWDYNYDTWFYMDTDEAPTLDFTVYNTTGDVSVSYATVTTTSAMVSSLSGWTALTADSEGRYVVDLLRFRDAGTKGGTVIIKMTDSSGTSYRLARVAESKVTIANVSAPGEALMPGDTVTLSFDGLYRSVNKIAGVFNPTTYKLRYTSGDKEVDGTLGQYQQMDNSSITLTIPEDVELDENGKGTYAFSNGYVFGSMYSAANPFSMMYGMTDTGVGTNFNAVTVNFCLHRLADVVIDVEKKVTLDLKVAPMDGETVVEGTTITLKDRTGKAMTANEQGIFESLSYGDYSYEIAKAGYLCTFGTLHLGAEDNENAVEGQVTKTIALTKGSENGWDGTTVTEPATDKNGVYQIGTGAELAWFAKTVNGGQTDISAVLTADIDLAQYNWTPIGNNSKKFAGTFDGKNHTVRNLAIRGSGNYQGLFGYVSGTTTITAEVRNLKVQGTMAFAGNASNAGTIGYATYAAIRNVHANVDISSATKVDTVGGVLGGATRETLVENCSNAGSITGYQYVGGVVGNGSIKTVTITGCVNTGHVTGTYWKIGGIVGQTAGPVTACYNTGRVDGVSGTGGIVGYGSGATAETRNCLNLGTVTGEKEFGSVVGQFNNAATPAENLYYLEGTCETGIGKLASGGKQTTQAITRDQLTGKALVLSLNAGLSAPAFGLGTDHPLLLWQDGAVYVVSSDLNSDNKTNMDDVSILLKMINGTITTSRIADLNGDGIINMKDVSVLLRQINATDITE